MRILICPGDRRMAAAGAALTRLGYTVRQAEPGAGETADVLVLPIPSLRGLTLRMEGSAPTLFEAAEVYGTIVGFGLPEVAVQTLRAAGKRVWDLGRIPAFVSENARLTAEAAVSLAIRETGRSPADAPVGILGYGRIAARLADLYLAYGAQVCVFARREEALAAARGAGCLAFPVGDLTSLAACRLVFNTIPAPLIPPETVSTVCDTVWVELASGNQIPIPGTLPEGSRVIDGHGLPGRVFPVSAGEGIARILCHILHEKDGLL